MLIARIYRGKSEYILHTVGALVDLTVTKFGMSPIKLTRRAGDTPYIDSEDIVACIDHLLQLRDVKVEIGPRAYEAYKETGTAIHKPVDLNWSRK